RTLVERTHLRRMVRTKTLEISGSLPQRGMDRMSKTIRTPAYRLHKQSGQAVVTLPDGLGGGRDVLLDRHGTRRARRSTPASWPNGKPTAGGRPGPWPHSRWLPWQSPKGPLFPTPHFFNPLRCPSIVANVQEFFIHTNPVAIMLGPMPLKCFQKF